MDLRAVEEEEASHLDGVGVGDQVCCDASDAAEDDEERGDETTRRVRMGLLRVRGIEYEELDTKAVVGASAHLAYGMGRLNRKEIVGTMSTWEMVVKSEEVAVSEPSRGEAGKWQAEE